MSNRNPADRFVDVDVDIDAATTVAPSTGKREQLRGMHQAAFDACLKEVFLKHKVQLREPIGNASRETVVFDAIYQGARVAVKIFTLATDDIRDAISAFGAFKVECEKTMILSRRSRDVVQVIEYGDADLPSNLPKELKAFFPLGIVPFMITELAPYGSLDRVMKRYRRLPGFDRVNLMIAMTGATRGIQEAHEHQVAHRDIKPQNLLIFGPSEAKIADFGIARWRNRLHRAEGNEGVMLTPRYASPEQAFHALTGESEGLVGIAGDIYSWAIMVYELVTGKHPFDWAIRGIKGSANKQKATLKAIASNDRRGFKPIGDITFDSLIDTCTSPLNTRIRDIRVANRVLGELVTRMRASS